MNLARPYSDIIASFGGKKILVVGDTILDVYLYGRSSRLCPEAPVPVVDVEERTAFLGGSANTVCNFKALGATVDFITVIGGDASGNEAIDLLARQGVSCKYVLKSDQRSTLVKTRVVSSGHIVTRFDAGTTQNIPIGLENKICELIKHVVRDYDAIVISDYDKGVISTCVRDCLSTLTDERQIYVAIDSKRLDFFAKLKPSFVKPNYEEATKLLGIIPMLKNRRTQMSDSGPGLFEATQSAKIALTLDADGSLVFENGILLHHHNAEHVQFPHVSGAGDTYLAAFVLSDLSNVEISMCSKIATAAATIAISKDYTSTCSGSELQDYFITQRSKIVNKEQLEGLCHEYRSAGKKIVFTNGCFDILHSGHVTYLQCAKDFGDVLIVGVNTDESIKRIKGEDRPINSLRDRMQVLEGLSCVTHLVAFGTEGDDTPVNLINLVKPAVFVKGGDYTREMLPEASTIERHGGKIHFVPQVPNHSTTSIIKRIEGTKEKPTVKKHYGQLERL